MVTVEQRGDDLAVSFTFDPEAVKRIKTLTRRYDAKTASWLVNSSRVHEVEKLFPGVSLPRNHNIANPSMFVFTKGFGLRDHQFQALQLLGGMPFCALLDAPGLGKTRVAISWVSYRNSFPCLVLCPSVVKIFWEREIQACLPNAVVDILSGRSVEGVDAILHGPAGIRRDAQWVIANYDILSDHPSLGYFGFKSMVLDEAHLTKTAARPTKEGKKRGSERGGATLRLAEVIPNIIALTGSPMPNGRPIELFPMLQMLRKVHPKEEWGWKTKFCQAERKLINEKGVKYHGRDPKYAWTFSGADHLDDLAAQLSTFSVQRRKEDVLESLPPIQHTVIDVEIDVRQAFSAGEAFAPGTPSKTVLAYITQKIIWGAKQKTVAAAEICRERLNSSCKSLVFCDYLEPLAILRKLLGEQSTILEGAMPESDRQAVIDRFQNDPTPHTLLCSRRLAGQSITLTAADACVFLHLPWVPGDYQQAIGRIHRMGQTKNTQSIVLVAPGTYDEEIVQILYGKAGNIELAAGRAPLPDKRKVAFERLIQLLGGETP